MSLSRPIVKRWPAHRPTINKECPRSSHYQKAQHTRYVCRGKGGRNAKPVRAPHLRATLPCPTQNQYSGPTEMNEPPRLRNKSHEGAKSWSLLSHASHTHIHLVCMFRGQTCTGMRGPCVRACALVYSTYTALSYSSVPCPGERIFIRDTTDLP